MVSNFKLFPNINIFTKFRSKCAKTKKNLCPELSPVYFKQLNLFRGQLYFHSLFLATKNTTHVLRMCYISFRFWEFWMTKDIALVPFPAHNNLVFFERLKLLVKTSINHNWTNLSNKHRQQIRKLEVHGLMIGLIFFIINLALCTPTSAWPSGASPILLAVHERSHD